jgi:hypothetical protein
MDWRLLAPLLVTSVVTIVGWLALRNDLNTELRLPRFGGPIWWLRIEPKSNDKH